VAVCVVFRAGLVAQRVDDGDLSAATVVAVLRAVAHAIGLRRHLVPGIVCAADRTAHAAVGIPAVLAQAIPGGIQRVVDALVGVVADGRQAPGGVVFHRQESTVRLGRRLDEAGCVVCPTGGRVSTTLRIL